MGVKFGELVEPRKVSLEELAGKSIAFDGNNILYQFLSIIRGQGGDQLKDSQGQVTSHLSGLLYRNSNLLEAGIKVAYVFDGRPHEFKKQILEARQEVRKQARIKFDKAVESGDTVAARKWGQQSVITTTNLIQDAKRLLTLMGIPWVQAPGEGEAQAAYMAAKGSVWASASQDYDSILFGAPRLIRNLSITGRRKLPKKNVYIKVEPEIIDLKNLLQTLEITWEQVIDVGILVGTDYNPGGVKGVGPKTALKIIKKHGELKFALPELKNPKFPHDIDDIREMFLKPIITDDFKLEWRKPDTAGILTYLCGEHNFNREKVLMAIGRMEKGFAFVRSTSTLDRFFNS
ncbi:MAG: flap endonuclease-1 [Candidatus Bathyarchaeota archaeon]|nr:flap endonuclease-1 [Candidatus Bathyarchaeota archaeon]